MRPLPPLYAITDLARGERALLDALSGAFRGGLRWVQVRERDLAEEDYRRLVERIRELAPADAIITLNRRVALVEPLGVAGVHTGGDPRRVAEARDALPAGALVGYSAHTPEEVDRVAGLGADYVSYSPVFRPRSKPSSLPPVGLHGIEALCARVRVPVFALGGVGPEHAARIRRAGAAGMAAIGAILDAPDPAAAVRAFLENWRTAGGPAEAP